MPNPPEVETLPEGGCRIHKWVEETREWRLEGIFERKRFSDGGWNEERWIEREAEETWRQGLGGMPWKSTMVMSTIMTQRRATIMKTTQWRLKH
jgi:hypothetical protein